MDVIFETQKGKPFSIEVGFFDTVLEIKEKIHKYHGIPIPHQTLIFNGNVLQDDRDVEYCEILQNSRIQLLVSSDSDTSNSTKQPQPNAAAADHQLPSPAKNAQLNSNTPSSNTVVPSETDVNDNPKKLKLLVLPKCGTKKIPVEVNATDNVSELRKELQKLHQRLQFHLPQEGYFFIYKQNVMDDDRSFRWHQVGQGDTIEIFNGSVTGGS
ncbi:ubiquitin domain-containing protein 7SL RNA1-like isoform X2 [Gossypium arboreum]|uniref:ubiquitin domain-containing protein 7SL RNA1-like isoform X2 n=1 Tax=Gossypium arboreum TaxID=29729 RepID=UPI00081913E9|nr:ubiquitin domain-containing protein 7SL RNA1-like isoform X2 [Gossypium arboreum]